MLACFFVSYYEINLADATLNLANTQINLGSVAASGANTIYGFSASANVENTQTTDT